VSLTFLSPEWADALTEAVNRDEAFAAAAAGQRARIQQVITTTDGEARYWTTIEDGKIAMGMGDLDAPDATIRQSYDTAVALAKRELSPVTGFMMGKIKVEGNMGMLMGLADALGKLADAMARLDVAY
jgi:putative sterol carrier protein